MKLSTAPPPLPGSLVLNVEGKEKEGKTTFALSATPPVAIISLDSGTARAVRNYYKRHPKWKFAMADPILYRPPIFTGTPSKQQIDAVAAAARPYWKKFRDTYMEVLKDRTFRSMVVDTGTALVDLAEFAIYGKNEKIPPLLRKIMNAQFMNLINAAKDAEKNVVFIHRVREHWIDKVDQQTGQSRPINTGEFKTDGWKSMNFEVDTVVRVFRGEDESFNARVIRSGENSEVDGVVLEGKQCNFASLASMIFDNEESDWK